MNKFLLAGFRLPLPVVMLGFITGFLGLFLPVVELTLPSTTYDHVLLVVALLASMLLLTVLYCYCQLSYKLNEYLDAEVQSEEALCRESQISNPLSLVTGQIYCTSEQQLQERIEQLRWERMHIGKDTVYDGEEQFEEQFEEPDYNAMAHEYEQERYHGDSPRY